jgi:Transposase DDE domain
MDAGMTTTGETKSDWEMIQTHLPSGWRVLSDEMGLIRERPAHMGTKIQDIGDILRIVLYQAGTSSSLRATAALAAATGVVTLSSVALHKWMRKLGPYLTVLLSRMVSTTSFSPEKWGGLHVIAGDATTVQRPASKGTTARVHYALRLADMTPRHIEVTDEHGGETARRFRAEAGEVWLLDRGYANPPGVAAIRETGAHIVVRHNRGTLPLCDKGGERLDVATLLQGTSDRERAYQRRAFVHTAKGRIEGRLCWLRLPTGKAEEARRRAAREAEGVCDAETLYTAEFVVLFTTILHELTAAQVLELYRARWQVELEFKRSKSIRELDRLPNFLPETIHSWICAKLLLQLVATRAGTPPDAFPPKGVRFTLLPGISAEQASSRRDGRRAVVRSEADLESRVRRVAASRAA